ncbi:MAG: DUF5675 family protein [candidate division WOR-3 bacterium]
MKFILRRLNLLNDVCFGFLLTDKGVFTTLEPNPPITPPGIYTCKRRWSNKFKSVVFEITNVPGHTDVLFHVGNFRSDTQGCVLLGLGLDLETKSIQKSKIAFKQFMDSLKDVNEFVLEIPEVM